MPQPLVNYQDRLVDSQKEKAMSQGNPEIYRRLPLGRGRRVFRVLTLFPGADHEQLCGKLDIQDLDETARVPYICLSYVWGNVDITEPLTVDDREVRVTANLVNCLYHLRQPKDPVVLWADAICINQQDTEEKSFQVSLMGDIYSA